MVNETNLRRDTFRLFLNLIDTNKANGWTVRANMPDVDNVNPLIIVNPVKIDRKRNSTDIGTSSDIAFRETFIELQVDILVHYENGMSVVDTGKDNIYETLTNTTNLTTLYADNIVFIDIQDSGMVDITEINGQNYLTTTIISRWKL